MKTMSFAQAQSNYDAMLPPEPTDPAPIEEEHTEQARAEIAADAGRLNDALDAIQADTLYKMYAESEAFRAFIADRYTDHIESRAQDIADAAAEKARRQSRDDARYAGYDD